MPVIGPAAATVYEMHNARFTSFATPATGSAELAAWMVEIQARSEGEAHTVTREEILHILEGELHVSLDGERAVARPGDTVIVPAGARFGADNPGERPVQAWVTTSLGLKAKLDDGTVITPPWAA